MNWKCSFLKELRRNYRLESVADGAHFGYIFSKHHN
jgi:hypothetical protein